MRDYGWGLIARDSEGVLVQAKTMLHRSQVNPELDEAMAVKEAFSWIKSMGWQKLVLESDCLVFVQAIRSKMQMRSQFGLIIQDCRRFTQDSLKIHSRFKQS